jgi:adenylosuccinate synthase
VLGRAVPVLEEFEGWEKTSGIRKYRELPPAARKYIQALETMIGVEIAVVSTGADEKDTIIRGKLAVGG